MSFAGLASEPVTRSMLARLVGARRNLDLLIDDIRENSAAGPMTWSRLPAAGST